MNDKYRLPEKFKSIVFFFNKQYITKEKIDVFFSRMAFKISMDPLFDEFCISGTILSRLPVSGTRGCLDLAEAGWGSNET